MSRRLSSTQRPFVYQPSKDNPYQATTVVPIPHTYNRSNVPQNTKERPPISTYSTAAHCNNVAAYDSTSASDDSCSDTNSYSNYYHYDYQCTCKRTSKNARCDYSDNEACKIQCYEYNQNLPKRYSRGSNPLGPNLYTKANKTVPLSNPNPRVISLNKENVQSNLNNQPLRLPIPGFAERPQSPVSSEVTSVVVDSCGGHCQTFENVCYYFLQVVFTMGILIGTSLSIAGAVLRKSAARNLQVLVYIGVLLAMVCVLLLSIQCSARYSARKRKKAIRNAKRAPIPLDTLNLRPGNLQQPLMTDHLPRGHIIQSQPQRNLIMEQQGIPWWRRTSCD